MLDVVVWLQILETHKHTHTHTDTDTNASFHLIHTHTPSVRPFVRSVAFLVCICLPRGVPHRDEMGEEDVVVIDLLSLKDGLRLPEGLSAVLSGPFASPDVFKLGTRTSLGVGAGDTCERRWGKTTAVRTYVRTAGAPLTKNKKKTVLYCFQAASSVSCLDLTSF